MLIDSSLKSVREEDVVDGKLIIPDGVVFIDKTLAWV